MNEASQFIAANKLNDSQFSIVPTMKKSKITSLVIDCVSKDLTFENYITAANVVQPTLPTVTNAMYILINQLFMDELKHYNLTKDQL